ncbi:MAG TPA: response regulator [Terriglobia bacterium]|nr:response regulator [Terriglobia bacterium]
MPHPILTLVDDLIFLAKIQQTAKQVGVILESVEPSSVKERATASSAHSIILDLNHRSGAALKVARAIKGDPATSHVRVMGFLSHVQTDLAAAAREAGCDDVLARSTFAQKLPQLLMKLAG